MFQNPLIAKRHGDHVEALALNAGRPAREAEILGKRAAVKKEKELDAWTKANVGLD